MANAHCDGPNSRTNAQEIRIAHLADSRMVNLPERSIDQWEAADAAQRLIELDEEARAHMTSEEYSESGARFAAFWAQHEEKALARYRALHDRNDSSINQECTNRRTRPLDSRFGSDGNQYNPYAPHTSEEYMLQEIEAGRMDPEMMNIPRHPLIPARSPLSGNGPGPQLAHVQAGGHVSWLAPGYRSDHRQGLSGRGVPIDLSDPNEGVWFQHPYDGSTAAEGLSEKQFPNVYRAMLPYLDIGGSPAGSHSPYGTTPDPIFINQESSVGIQGPVTSSLDPPTLDDMFGLETPRQPHLASTGRERKRLPKPSLVVKLKTDSAQKSSQAPVSTRRGRSDASSSSESSSAMHTTKTSRPLNLRSGGSVVMSSANTRTRTGWDPQAIRRLTRKADALQSSHRKRRRDAVSPQDVSTTGTTSPTASLPQGT